VQPTHHARQVARAHPDLGLVERLANWRGELVGERLLQASLELGVRFYRSR